ncbi:MAG: DUF559 domain-containing protein [Actinomycetes bacterium]
MQAGMLTRRVLAGPRYRRLFPDVYAPAELPADLVLRSRAAAVLVGSQGALSGYSAAELLRASCGPEDAAAEVTVTAFRRPTPGLIVHRDVLFDEEVKWFGGLLLTTPEQTAFDIVRWHDLVSGVVAVDALAHQYPTVTAGRLRSLRNQHRGARGIGKLDAVLALIDPRSQSPMESRIRVALTLGGLVPTVQHPVTTESRNYFLDTAFPKAKLGVEHDGGHHRDPEQALRDLEREAMLARAGWKILRFPARTVLCRPDSVVARTVAELRLRSS